MAAPTEPILLIATDTLGGDGFTNKEAPTAPVTNEGYGKQSLNYQQLNYMFNNQAQWLNHMNERGIPEWQILTSYPLAAKVQYQGNFYTAVTANVGSTPVIGGTVDWLQDVSNRRFSDNAEAIAGTDATVVINPTHLKVVADEANSIRTTTGTSTSDVDMGTFTGDTISDNVSIKVGMQELESAAEAIDAAVDTISVAVGVSGSNVTIANDLTVSNNLTVTGISATVNSKSIITDVAKSLSTSGYQKLSNGLILQWGELSVSGDAGGTITWPTTFSTACLQAVVSHGASSSIADGNSTSLRIYGLTTTGSSVFNDAPVTTTARYIAIGH